MLAMAVENYLTAEEKDHLERSINNVDPAVDSPSMVCETPEVRVADVQDRPISFKNMLVKGDSTTTRAVSVLEKVVMEDDFDCSDTECPREGDRDESFSFIELLKAWNPLKAIEFEDLGLGCYVAKFASKEDLVKVLCNGPYRVLDHCLLVQRWKPNFRPSTTSFDSTLVWIRLPELPIEYFPEELLLKVAKSIGNPMKLDKPRHNVNGKGVKNVVHGGDGSTSNRFNALFEEGDVLKEVGLDKDADLAEGSHGEGEVVASMEKTVIQQDLVGNQFNNANVDEDLDMVDLGSTKVVPEMDLSQNKVSGGPVSEQQVFISVGPKIHKSGQRNSVGEVSGLKSQGLHLRKTSSFKSRGPKIKDVPTSKVSSASIKKGVGGTGKASKDKGGVKSVSKAPNIMEPLDVLNHLASPETLLQSSNLVACVPPSLVEGFALANVVAEPAVAPANQESS
ncbi:hypothetical protein COLO4_21322 [Corchorus olitorius]|uniref:DUF4283 domain-containing protein n=1 Tax=Corchorus olitorius TaxID=93759 RepID=A0A1R3IU12_9ROSI|nr:hypothetical protein COLO4_21322 [Corchorus olitorius]